MARTQPSRLPAAERRQQVLESSRRVFLAHGAGAGTRQLAEAAGINSALLYHYFETKEAIFEAAVMEPLRAMVAEVFDIGNRMSSEELPDRPREAEQALLHMVKAIREVLPLLGLVLFSEEEMGRRFYREHLHPMLEQSFEAGRPGFTGWAEGPLHPWMVTAIFGMCLGLAMDYHFLGKEADDRQVARDLADLMLNGLPVSPIPKSSPAKGSRSKSTSASQTQRGRKA